MTTKVSILLNKSHSLKPINKYFETLNIKRLIDNYHNKHSKVVIDICIILINELNWGEDEAKEIIIYATLLKDIELEKNLIKLSNLDVINKHSDRTYIIGHPGRVSQGITKSDFTIPVEVGAIILQHHEMPDGNGFPSGLKDQQITPMASLLIVAEDMAYYILDNPNWIMKEYLVQARVKYCGSTFMKIITAIDDSQK